MAIPKLEEFNYPFLNFCKDKKELSLNEIRNHLTEHFELTPEDYAELTPNGKNRKFYYQIGWAKSYLLKAKLIEYTKRSHFRITKSGLDILEKFTETSKISLKNLMAIDEFREFKTGVSNSLPTEDVDFENLEEIKLVPTPEHELPLNLILYGPPGTGKTYSTKHRAFDVLGIDHKSKEEVDIKFEFDELVKDGQIVFTTFHQSLTYEDFIEGIKPSIQSDEEKSESKNRTLEYSIQDGIFKKLCKKAEEDAKNNYVLIIDEINRGDVSKIFGELITLLEEDKREGNVEAITVTLPYSKLPFSVPKNLYVIGTMNTADRSVESLDTALRRRFSFQELMPDYSLDALKTEVFDHTLGAILKTINDRIEILLERDHLIGHSYFMKVENEVDFLEVMYSKVIPLLQEYFYNDYEKIGMILGSDFVEIKKATSKPEFANFKFDRSDDYSGKDTYSFKTKEKILHLENLKVMKVPIKSETKEIIIEETVNE